MTEHYSPITFLQVKFSVKQHQACGENVLTHSVLLFHVSVTPSCFHCSDSHKALASVFHLSGCSPNRSGDILYGTKNPMLGASWIVHSIAYLYFKFNHCLPVVFALIWIIQVTIPVKPILNVGNLFKSLFFITICWMEVNSVVWV